MWPSELYWAGLGVEAVGRAGLWSDQFDAMRQKSLIRLAAGSNDEVDLLADVAQVMSDSSICGFGHAASWAVQSALRLGLIGGTS